MHGQRMEPLFLFTNKTMVFQAILKSIQMKNSIFFFALFTFTFFTTNMYAQPFTDEVEFKKGDIEIGLGIGLLPTFVSENAKTKIPPVSIMLGYRIKQFFSLGAYAGFSSSDGYDVASIFDDPAPEDPVLRNDFYILGLRAEGHFNRERTDFYGGAMISYNYSDITTELKPGDKMPENIEIEKDNGGFKYSGYIGLKYMATKRFGIFGEVGYGVSLINLGLTSKF